MKRYRIAVDIGGTFVDAIMFDQVKGAVRLAKASTTPDDPSRGVMEALQRLGADLSQTDLFIHGTTLGLNAVIERRGVPTGIITNEGFRDIFEIGRGDVPPASMYDFAYQRPEPLVRRRHRIGVPGRLDVSGTEITPLDEAAVRAAAGQLVGDDIRSIAICFLHSYRNPAHEQRAAAVIREAYPEVAVSISSEITREYREYERTATTVMDAYINPIFAAYVDRLDAMLVEGGFDGQFLLMRSAGGAMSAAAAKRAPIYTVLSGPAGGIIGAAHLARLLGKDHVLTLDYGGTSLDAAIIENGEPLIMHQAKLDHYPAQIPIFDIRCIGAGGGSIAWVSEGLLQVGPHSAGASPGPIAYGRGGTEPTTTDAALILGFLDPDAFLGGTLKLDIDAAWRGMAEKVAGPMGTDPISAAAGVFDVLVARTAGAIRELTVERGKDPRDFSMMAFGGAGPMIAPLIAREVENFELLIPHAPAVFSASGMLMSDLVTDVAQTDIRMLTEESVPAVEAGLATLIEEGRAALAAQGVEATSQEALRLLECRYLGQEHALEVPLGDGLVEVAAVRARFDALHAERYGHAMKDPVQIVTLRVRTYSRLPKPRIAELEPASTPVEAARIGERQAYCFARRAMCRFDVYERSRLALGHVFDGPAIIEEGTTTSVIHSDQSVSLDAYGHIVVRRRMK